MQVSSIKKIVLPDPPFFDDAVLKQIADRNKIDYKVYDSLAIDPSLLGGRIGDADIAIVDILSEYNKDSLEQCKNLKHLITATVGYNHIDTDYCRERGISLYRFSQYNSRAVAELAISLIISLLRKVGHATTRLKQVFG